MEDVCLVAAHTVSYQHTVNISIGITPIRLSRLHMQPKQSTSTYYNYQCFTDCNLSFNSDLMNILI